MVFFDQDKRFQKELSWEERASQNDSRAREAAVERRKVSVAYQEVWFCETCGKSSCGLVGHRADSYVLVPLYVYWAQVLKPRLISQLCRVLEVRVSQLLEPGPTEQGEERLRRRFLHLHELVYQRNMARQQKDWAAADRIRTLLEANGFEARDTEFGTQLILLRRSRGGTTDP